MRREKRSWDGHVYTRCDHLSHFMLGRVMREARLVCPSRKVFRLQLHGASFLSILPFLIARSQLFEAPLGFDFFFF